MILVVRQGHGPLHLAFSVAGRGYATACGRVMPSTVTVWRKLQAAVWLEWRHCRRCEQVGAHARTERQLAKAAGW